MKVVFRSVLFSACVLVVLFGQSLLLAQAPAKDSLGTEVHRFEQVIKWDSVSPTWAKTRDEWVQRVTTATDSKIVANAILELEAAMGWKSVNENWKTRRDPWITEMKASAKMADVAKLLLELESNTNWEAVDSAWKASREAWAARVDAIAASNN